MTTTTLELEGAPAIRTPSDFFDVFDPLIVLVSAQEHKNSHLFDRSDLEQEIRLACMKQIDYLLDADEHFIRFFCRRAARTYAAQTRVSYEYFSGRFVYTPEIVRAQLESSTWSQEDEGDWDIRLDVRQAWGKLPTAQQRLVWRAYALGESLNSSERKETSRGIERMVRHLNQKLVLTIAPLHETRGV